MAHSGLHPRPRAIILLNYSAALLIEGAAGRRRRLLPGVSIAANLGVLFVFKYVDFFNASARSVAEALGLS